MTVRLHEKYKKEITNKLKEKYNYKNSFQKEQVLVFEPWRILFFSLSFLIYATVKK